ncbi:MAG TPA: hypothetical protein PKC41_11900, partial [Chitinophagaceae bacterium]|nr:hypothetical protein [Chitinophagaceae bacterium]
SRINISGGVGYRAKNWFLDAAYVYATQKTQQMPYTLIRANADVQAANIQNNVSKVLFTLGMKF